MCEFRDRVGRNVNVSRTRYIATQRLRKDIVAIFEHHQAPGSNEVAQMVNWSPQK